MTCYLLDVNVLIPILWPRHTEQARVRSWFLANASAAFATCSLTQAGFLRLTSTPEAMRETYTLRQARALLFAFVQQPGHIFWPTTIDVFEAISPFERRMQGAKQITSGSNCRNPISNGRLAQGEGAFPWTIAEHRACQSGKRK